MASPSTPSAEVRIPVHRSRRRSLNFSTVVGGFGTTSGSGLGGGVANFNGTVTVESSTLSFNTAADGGGALFSLAYDGSGSHTAVVSLMRSVLSDSPAGVDLLVHRPAEIAPGLGNVAVVSVTRDGHDLIETTEVRGTVLSTARRSSPTHSSGRRQPTAGAL